MNITDPEMDYIANIAIDLGAYYIKIMKTKSQILFIAQFDNVSRKGQPLCLNSRLNVPTADEPSTSNMKPPSS